MFKNHLLLFTSPDDTPGKGESNVRTLPADDKESVIEFLADDEGEEETIPIEGDGKKKGEKEDKKDDKTPIKTKGLVDEEEEEDTDKEDEDDEVDELKELEEELEEPSEEQLELVTPVRRREILKKYPQLFKDFPYLEKAYYREQQFTELLPTIEDAKVAVEKSETLDRFEHDVMGGNTETILKSVKQTDPNAFNRIVDNYLTTLANVDEKAYFHVLGNVTKHTIFAMAQEGKRTGNEALQQAAHLVNQFVFGTSDWQPPTNLAKDVKPEDNTRENKLTEREQGFIKQQFETTRGDLNTRVNNALRNTIDANIDPKQSMTDYVRRNASRDAMDTLESLISKDPRFRALVDKLWDKAFQDNFSQESKDRIRSAYVSKAKTLLPSVIKKARNEALRGIGKRVREDDSETTESGGRKGPVREVGRPRSQNSSGKVNKASDIPAGMSTLDFLNSD